MNSTQPDDHDTVSFVTRRRLFTELGRVRTHAGSGVDWAAETSAALNCAALMSEDEVADDSTSLLVETLYDPKFTTFERRRGLQQRRMRLVVLSAAAILLIVALVFVDSHGRTSPSSTGQSPVRSTITVETTPTKTTLDSATQATQAARTAILACLDAARGGPSGDPAFPYAELCAIAKTEAENAGLGDVVVSDIQTLIDTSDYSTRLDFVGKIRTGLPTAGTTITAATTPRAERTIKLPSTAVESADKVKFCSDVAKILQLVTPVGSPDTPAKVAQFLKIFRDNIATVNDLNVSAPNEIKADSILLTKTIKDDITADNMGNAPLAHLAPAGRMAEYCGLYSDGTTKSTP